jgi:gas vesicle protein
LSKEIDRRFRMRSASYLLSGVLLGGFTGAVLVLLFTPASGENIRSQIGSSMDEFRGNLETVAQQRRQELEDELKKLRSGA